MVVRSPSSENPLLTNLYKTSCHWTCRVIGVGLVKEEFVLVIRLHVKAVLTSLWRSKPAIEVVHGAVVLRSPERLQSCGQGFRCGIIRRVAVCPVRLDIWVLWIYIRVCNTWLAGLRPEHGGGPLVSRLAVELLVGGSGRVNFTRDTVDGDSSAGKALEPPPVDDEGLAAQPVA